MQVMVYDKIQTLNGINLKLNPDKKIVGAIISRCLSNDGYCPCRPERVEPNKCPCKPMIEKGHCCCNLYVEDKYDDE